MWSGTGAGSSDMARKIIAAFEETHGFPPRSKRELINWAWLKGLITDDQVEVWS